MKKFEYKYFNIDYTLYHTEIFELNELGAEGWEVIHTDVGDNSTTHLLKREVATIPLQNVVSTDIEE